MNIICNLTQLKTLLNSVNNLETDLGNPSHHEWPREKLNVIIT